MALLAVVLFVTACSTRDEDRRPRPDSTPTTRPGTVARAEVGDRLTVTATVDRVLTDTVFVVRDVDLADGTLLVLSMGPSVPDPPQLVTVEGSVVRFSHRDLAVRYRLGPVGPYRTFEGRHALVAQRMTVWE